MVFALAVPILPMQAGAADGQAPDCSDGNLRERSKLPVSAVCQNGVYDLPAPEPHHLLQIAHYRRTLPFEEFENWLRKLGRDPRKVEADRKFIDFVMNGAVRNELLGFETYFEAEGYDFRWMDGSEQWLKDWSKPYPTEFMPVVYPPGTCVHVKEQLRYRTSEGIAIDNRHTLDCWIADFETRRVLDDRISYYDSFLPGQGAHPVASLDADAAALFRSLRPPDLASQ